MRLDVHHHFPLIAIDVLERIVLNLHRIANNQEGQMANITEVLAAVARTEGNVANVQRVLGIVNEQNAQLLVQVSQLQDQIASGAGVTGEDLQQIVDRLNIADAAMDSLAPEAPDQPNDPGIVEDEPIVEPVVE